MFLLQSPATTIPHAHNQQKLTEFSEDLPDKPLSAQEQLVFWKNEWDPAPQGIGIFIDEENIGPRPIPEILETFQNKGGIEFAIAFGSKFQTKNNAWHAISKDYQVELCHCASVNKSGKNAADVSMAFIIGELSARSKNVGTYVIITSDSDFTYVAANLVKAGKIVHVFGGKSTPQPLREAASFFHPIPSPCKSLPAQSTQSKPKSPSIPFTAPELELIKNVCNQNKSSKGWINLTKIANPLREQISCLKKGKLGLKLKKIPWIISHPTSTQHIGLRSHNTDPWF